MVVARDLLEGQMNRLRHYSVVWFMETNHGSYCNITSQWRCLICIDHGSRQLTRFMFFNTPKIPQENSVNLLKCIFSCIYCIKQIDSIFPLSVQLQMHRGRHNVVRTSVTHSPRRLVGHFFLLTTLWHHLCVYNWTDNGKMKSIC